MSKVREEIKEIITMVRECFDDMEEIDCTPEGLFKYIKEGNEAFLYKNQADDKLCYLCAFRHYAQKTGLNFPEDKMKNIVNEIEMLKERYPKHFKLVTEILV